MSGKKMIDYFKSYPVKCRTGVYADARDGTRLCYDAESDTFKPDTKSGKKTKVKKKLMRPLYSFRVDFKEVEVVTDIYRAEEINKYGLNWSSRPVYHSVYNTNSCTYTESGLGTADKWFSAERDFDIAELIAEQYSKEENIELKLIMDALLLIFLNRIPYGEKIREECSELSAHSFLTYLYSGAYQKLCNRENAPKKLCFGLEVEFTGIARGSAAAEIAKLFGTEKRYTGGTYCKHIVKDSSDRIWTVMRDGSILPDPEHRSKPVDYYRCEFVTPICTEDDIPVICAIIRALKKRGMKVNTSCGIHIHVDVKTMNKNHIINLVNLMASKEDLIFKALNVSDSRRSEWCKEVDSRFLSEINNEKIISMNELKRKWYDGRIVDSYSHYHDSRYHALNLHSFWENKGVEFRMFNSTVDDKEIKAYIYLALAMCRHARKIKHAAYISRSKADEKTQFRSWLQQIGLKGKKYTDAREQLMKNFKSESTERRMIA